jgi:hypothetical protein
MALTPANIHQGAMRLFYGVTAGATGTPPTYIGHTAGVPATGTELGLTEGDCICTYKQTKALIKGEQALGAVDVAVTNEEGKIAFTCKETTYITLQAAFDPSVGKEDVAGGRAMYFGGGAGVLAPTTNCLMGTSLQRNAAGKYCIFVLYRVVSMLGMEINVGKIKESMFKVEMEGLFDLTRNAGDQMGYLRWEK